MELQEALNKIDEISTVIKSSNTALFSGQRMILNGVLLLLIPLIGSLTQWLTFGHDFGVYQTAYIAIANTLFYWGLSILSGRIFPRSKKLQEHKESQHPLIKKAFSITRPILFSIIGVVFVFSLTQHAEFIYPVVLILLGIMFSIFSLFTIPVVSYFAWSYIFCGLLHLYLIQYNISYLGFYFLIYNGLSYIFMGYLLSQEEKRYVS